MKSYIVYEVLRGKKYTLFNLLKVLLFSPPFRFVYYFRLMEWFRDRNFKIFAGILYRKLIFDFGCYIGNNVSVGLGVKFPHPNGIVIGEYAVIGKNCTIFQQVTFGGKVLGDAKDANYPKIGDNVVIFAGAKLIGNISIGDNVIIGANSVVNKNFPSNTVIGGIPAKVLKVIENK